MASGDKPPPSAFVEAEAEESGDEGAGSGDGEEENEADNAADLDGFIDDAQEDEQQEGGGDSSSSGEEAMDETLHEDDLKVLQEAGLDISQVHPQRRVREESKGAGEPPQKRAKKTEEDNLEAELFGDVDDEDADRAVVPAGERDDIFAGLSEDDVDDFIVEDPDAARRKGEAAEFNITEEQLQEVVDIFGDTSVLRPIDEIGEGEEPELPEKLPEDSISQAMVPAPEDVGPEADRIDVPEENMEMDPDLKIKLYETKRDFIMEARDVPERWIQTYEQHSELLDRDGVRRWTDEEHDCEAKWIYNEAFWEKDYDRVASESITRQILEMLHTQMLEPVYVVSQFAWQFGRFFTAQDIWKIVELDRQWQNLWVMYQRLSDWIHKVEDQVPMWIAAKVDQRIWGMAYAETDLKDAYEWFSVAYPDVAVVDGKSVLAASEVQKLLRARQYKFDEKLGIKESIEEMSLQVFGITPSELGDNVEQGKQVTAPSPDNDARLTVEQVCGEHINRHYQTYEAVLDAVMMYLSRLIASDARVRRYVRKEFWKTCAISTTPTEAGKSVALDAAHSFRRQYRAFHLVNRPVSLMTDDELFLDVLWLQRKGFLNVEYSLVVEDTKSKETNPHAYRYVMLGHDEVDLVKDRRLLAEHERQQRAAVSEMELKDDEISRWNWCKAMVPRLEAVSRAHEIENRRKSTAGHDSTEKANALFKCASMNFSADHLYNFLSYDPILTHLLKLYCTVEEQGQRDVFVVPNEWNNVRKRIILRVLRDELYPMFWQEVQVHLSKKAEEIVCRQCCEKLLKIVDVQPWRLTEQAIKEQQDEDRLKYAVDIDDVDAFAPGGDEDDPEWIREKKFRLSGACSIVVIINAVSKSPTETSVVALVNPFGDPVEMRVLFKGFAKPREVEPGVNDMKYLKYMKMLEHKKIFMNLLKKHRPAIILLPVNDREVAMMRDDIKALIDEPEMAKCFKMKPTILLGDPSVSRVVAYHSRAMEEGVYRDCELPLQRIAISCARFVQDPLAETAMLWHEIPEENGLFRLRLHRLQQAVPKNRLGLALLVPLMETLGKCGLHINRVRRSPHLASLAALLPGFGPRKVRLFKKCLADAVTSRAGLAKLITKFLHRPGSPDPSKSPVIINAMPFIKIAPDLRDPWNPEHIKGLDRTRLGEAYRPWITALCGEALKMADEQDTSGLEPDQDLSRGRRGASRDPVADAMATHSKEGNMERILQEVNLDEWQHLAGVKEVSDYADLDDLLSKLIPEVLEPFKDTRQEFTEVEDQQAFYLTVGDTEDNISMGSVVHTVVVKDQSVTEEGDLKEGRPQVTVQVLPSMVRGLFKKMHHLSADKAGYITGCDMIFERGQEVIARVIDIRTSPGRPPLVTLSVDPDEGMWSKRFPIQDDEAPFFVPLVSENWTHIKLGAVDMSKAQKEEALKDWVRRPRNIRHTNWTDADHERSLKIIDNYLLGNVLFRPSRRHDAIVAMLKVRNTPATGEDAVPVSQCFRTFDVIEKSEKTVTKGFEIAKDLEVEGCVYTNFDEIIARHMDPIMDYLRLLQEHPHYGLRKGMVTDRYQVRDALADFTRQDKKMLFYVLLLHDKLIGHGLLVWALGGHKPREEFIEISPTGYTLWCNSFETVPAMVQWFKTVGWRNATRCRKDFKEAWAKRKAEAQNRRGPDAFEDRDRKKKFTGWNPETTTKGGLQTPGGGAAAGTPTFYGLESAAATPRGMATPAGGFATPSGTRTPYMDLAAPGTPGAPMTPAGVRGGVGAVPATPSGAFGRGFRAAPSTPHLGGQAGPAAPGTAVPNHLAATPTGLAVNARGQPVPSTPVGPLGMAAATPATFGGAGPMTPALTRSAGAPPTPQGATASAAGRIPMTPKGAVPMTPVQQGSSVAPLTPAGFAPASPAPMQVTRGAPLTPAGFVPMSPAPVTLPSGSAPRTPAEPVPQTPGLRKPSGGAPSTPR